MSIELILPNEKKLTFAVLDRLPGLKELRERVNSINKELKTKEELISADIRKLAEYWVERSGGGFICHVDHKTVLYEEYLCSIIDMLSKVCNNEFEFLEGGKRLLDLTYGVYQTQNGSYDYICKAVPSLVESSLVKTEGELIRGAEIIGGLPILTRFNGSKVFPKVAHDVKMGKISSLDELANWKGLGEV